MKKLHLYLYRNVINVGFGAKCASASAKYASASCRRPLWLTRSFGLNIHVPLFSFCIVWLYVLFAAQQLAQRKTSMLELLVVCILDSPITERRGAEYFAKKITCE